MMFKKLLLSLFLPACLAGAHGLNGLCQQPRLPEPTSPPDATAFAQELLAHHRYLFNDEELERIDKLLSLELEEDPAARRQQVDSAEREFVNLLSGSKNLIEVDVPEPGKVDMKLPHPIESPGDSVGLLLRINSGEGETNFSTACWDLQQHWETEKTVHVPYIGTGTTYAIVLIDLIPAGKSDITLHFSPVETPDVAAPAYITLMAPRSGELVLDLLDENGETTPAMIRMVSSYDNRMRTPANAIDFVHQMEKGGTPPPGYTTDVRYIQQNGPLFNQNFHCVPSSFSMALPPGEYTLAVYKGHEYITQQHTFIIRPDETTNMKVEMKRWVHMAKRGWYSGDGHVHAAIMNDRDAKHMMAFTKATDTNVSNILAMGDHRRIWYRQRGFGPDYRVQDGDYVLVPGQEGPRYFNGHAAGLNLKKMVRDADRYLDNAWVADEIHKDGGLYGHCHLAHQLFEIDRDLTMLMVNGKSDFGEILQFNHLGTELYYEYLNLGFKFTAMAGSDMPYGGSVGDVRAYAKIDDPMKDGFDVDKWFEAVRKGKTFVSNGPMIGFSVDDEGSGGEILIDGEKSVHIRAKAWGLENASAPAKLQIISQGEVVKEIAGTDASQDSLKLDFDLDVRYGAWIAVNVLAHDGSVAHSTPVYVIRKGYRFWSTEKVPDLLKTRYAQLDNLEEQLLLHKQWKKDGNIPPENHFGMGLANQCDAILPLVEKVRLEYEKLEEIHRQELQKRTDH
ncbi:MAG: CehA/McbA family metallohydrolase [Verrucomicrobiota bacterium]